MGNRHAKRSKPPPSIDSPYYPAYYGVGSLRGARPRRPTSGRATPGTPGGTSEDRALPHTPDSGRPPSSPTSTGGRRIADVDPSPPSPAASPPFGSSAMSPGGDSTSMRSVGSYRSYRSLRSMRSLASFRSLRVQRGPSPRQIRLENLSRFLDACQRGQLSTARLLADQVPVNSRDKWGDTALHIAAANGKLNIVRWLVKERAADVNSSGFVRNTPLHKAAGRGNERVLKCLLRAGASVEMTNGHGETPVDKAKAAGHLHLVQLLTDGLGSDDEESEFSEDETDIQVANESLVSPMRGSYNQSASPGGQLQLDLSTRSNDGTYDSVDATTPRRTLQENVLSPLTPSPALREENLKQSREPPDFCSSPVSSKKGGCGLGGPRGWSRVRAELLSSPHMPPSEYLVWRTITHTPPSTTVSPVERRENSSPSPSVVTSRVLLPTSLGAPTTSSASRRSRSPDVTWSPRRAAPLMSPARRPSSVPEEDIDDSEADSPSEPRSPRADLPGWTGASQSDGAVPLRIEASESAAGDLVSKLTAELTSDLQALPVAAAVSPRHALSGRKLSTIPEVVNGFADLKDECDEVDCGGGPVSYGGRRLSSERNGNVSSPSMTNGSSVNGAGGGGALDLRTSPHIQKHTTTAMVHASAV